jgi:hypothetical protein
MTTDSIALIDERADVRAILTAFIRDGEFAAAQTDAFLKRWTKSLGLRKLPPLPAEFLLELSAVLRIASWQSAGLDTQMKADFPTASELLRELIERLLKRPESFAIDLKECDAPLTGRVTRLWLRHCSWSAPTEFGVDVVVRRPDRELLWDAVA